MRTARWSHRSIDTTIGRIIFNDTIPQDLGFVDARATPTEHTSTTRSTFTVRQEAAGQDRRPLHPRCTASPSPPRCSTTSRRMGYKYSTSGAITISVADMTVPDEKYDAHRRGREAGRGHRATSSSRGLHHRRASATALVVAELGKDHQGRHRRPAEEPGPTTTPSS